MMKKVLIGAMTAALAVGASTAAVATDDLLFPGSSCVRYGTGAIAYSYSAIQNSSTLPLQIDCPAVRDQTGHSIADGWVRVIDQHFTEDVVCELLSVQLASVSTGWVFGSGQNSSDGTSTSVQVLNFGAVGTTGGSHNFYSCVVPGTYTGVRSWLTTYRVNENN